MQGGACPGNGRHKALGNSHKVETCARWVLTSKRLSVYPSVELGYDSASAPSPGSPLPTSAGYVTIVPTREWLRFCGSLWLRFAGSFSGHKESRSRTSWYRRFWTIAGLRFKQFRTILGSPFPPAVGEVITGASKPQRPSLALIHREVAVCCSLSDRPHKVASSGLHVRSIPSARHLHPPCAVCGHPLLPRYAQMGRHRGLDCRDSWPQGVGSSQLHGAADARAASQASAASPRPTAWNRLPRGHRGPSGLRSSAVPHTLRQLARIRSPDRFRLAWISPIPSGPHRRQCTQRAGPCQRGS